MKKVLAIFLLTFLVIFGSCQRECSFCKGSNVCNTCDGDGVRSCYMISRAISGGAPHNKETCTVCHGDGQMICNACNGNGNCSDCS